MNKRLLLIAIVVLTASCTPRWYSGASPITPAMPTLNEFAVDETSHPLLKTLTPEFSWKDIREKEGQSYDICIWKPIELNYSSEEAALIGTGANNSWGETTFCKTNISATKYQFAESLDLDTYYNWSVRLRDGDKVMKWSSFRFGGGYRRGSNYPYGFKTPPN